MITIDGTPLSPQVFHNGTISSPIQQQIAAEMQHSRMQYNFKDMDELLFQLLLRENIVLAAYAQYQSGVGYAVFENAYCNPEFWQLTPVGGFLQRKDVRASDAINDIFEQGHLYAFECATAMIIVLYKAVLDTLGAEAFDKLFKNLYLYAWQYDENLGLTTLTGLEFFPGDILYFSNPDVHPAHPEWQGENVVLMENHLFYGHGMGILPANQVIAGLNAQRRPRARISAHLLDQATRPNFEYLQQFYKTNRLVTASIGRTTRRWAYS